MLYYRQKRYDEAENMMRKVIQIKPEPNAYSNLGLVLYKKGDYDEAYKILLEAISKYPDIDRIYTLLGRLYILWNQKEEAKKMFEKALESNPGNRDALFELGLMYFDEKNYSEAEEKFGGIFTEGESMADYEYGELVNSGWEATKNKRLEEAKWMLVKAIALNPTYDHAYNKLGIVYFSSDFYDDGERMFRRALKINPNDTISLYNLATRYKDLNRSEESINMFKRINEILPDDILSLINLANGYKHFNMTVNLTDTYEHILTLDPNHHEALVKLGFLYLEQGKEEEAMEMFRRVIELKPVEETENSHLELIWYYLNNDMEEEAEQLFASLKEVTTKQIRIYDRLGARFEEQNQTLKAMEMYKRSKKIRENSFNPSVKENYQRMYEILEGKNIVLIAVQYPTRDLEELRGYFNDENIIFVSNQDNFEDDLARLSYDEVFSDHEHGNWGHGTELGNRLIAENVADTIFSLVS